VDIQASESSYPFLRDANKSDVSSEMKITNNKVTVRYLILVIIALVLLGGVENAKAQEGSKIDPRRQLASEDTANTSAEKRALPYFSPKKPVDCEVANFYIDDVIRRWQENNSGSYLIVIARLGDGENSRQLNLARLKSIRRYLKRYPDTRLITAEGERVNGYGCLEFYVNGKRLYVIPVIKSANIDLFSCNGV
jgi:hypothetical protein